MRFPVEQAGSQGNTAYVGAADLWASERNLTNYNSDLVAKLTKYHARATHVLEFGAGIGTLAELWKRSTGVAPDCVEIDSLQRTVIERRGFRCHESLASVDATFDLIYTSNVLEHIEDDAYILRQLSSKVRPGGGLAVYVPAFPLIYSQFDGKVGHCRRYTKHDLLQKIREAGFIIQECHFADCIGFFAWLYIKARDDSSNESREARMKLYDRYIFPISSVLDVLGCKHLFGKNLLVYAKKP